MRIFVLFILGLCACAVGQDSLRTVIFTKVTPLFDQPLAGSLPAAFVEKGDTARVDSTLTDSAGVSWFHLRTSTRSQWTNTPAFSYVTPQSEDIRSQVLRSEATDKRRLRILHDHPEWPRRIRNGVREGKVCLGMTPDQLQAAWGEPFQMGKSFVLGTGECTTWFFHGTNEGVLFVLLSQGGVVGWYQGEINR